MNNSYLSLLIPFILISHCLWVSEAQARTPGYDVLTAGYSTLEVEGGGTSRTVDFSIAYLYGDRFYFEAQVSDGDYEFGDLDSVGDARRYDVALSYGLNSSWFVQLGRIHEESTISAFETKLDTSYVSLGWMWQASHAYFDFTLGAYDLKQTGNYEFAQVDDQGPFISAYYRHYFGTGVELELELQHFMSDPRFSFGSVNLIYNSELPFDFYVGASLGDQQGIFGGLRLEL